MFGRHHETAQATVLYAEDITGQWADHSHVKIEFVLEVHAPTGQVFRAKATHHFITFTHYPQVGDIVNVRYDPQSLKVDMDLENDLRYGWKGLKHKEQLDHQSARNQRDALLSAPPGTPLPSAGRSGGTGAVPLDAELLELMALEEAERQQATSSPAESAGWTEEQRLRQELAYSGVSGRATIRQKRQTGAPYQQFAPFFVDVMVYPDASSVPFECSFLTWVDISRGTLMEGYTLPVRYDPHNPARIVFIWPT